MKNRILSLLLFVLVFTLTKSFAQTHTMPNFNITDTEGVTHNLYVDHLDQGKTVVIKFFFTTCPPCQALAPWWQGRHVHWGSGNHDVSFMELSTLVGDNNTKVKNYKTAFNLTMIAAGDTGGSLTVANPFKTGTYGPWYGTPSFAVIAPNKLLYYPVFTDELDDIIALTGAQPPGGNIPDPTIVNLNLTSNIQNIPSGDVRFFLKPTNAAEPKIEILKNAQGKYTFVYPSAQFPLMNQPTVVVESTSNAYHSSINSGDLVDIRRHILVLKTITNSDQLLAADVNNDNKINTSDIVNIQKVILGLDDKFPNGVKSYKTIPEHMPVVENSGQTVELNFKIIKMGNVN
jgi:thiol-disulfide isomerase/thioredoxin